MPKHTIFNKIFMDITGVSLVPKTAEEAWKTVEMTNPNAKIAAKEAGSGVVSTRGNIFCIDDYSQLIDEFNKKTS